MFAIFVKAVLISGLLATTPPADHNAATVEPCKPTAAVPNPATPSTTTETSTDSTTAPVEPLDLLSKVDSFYNNAFVRLVEVLAIGLLIVGIIIPLTLELARRSSFAKELSKLKAELQKTTDIRIESVIEKLEKRQDELSQQSYKNLAMAVARSLSLFASRSYLLKDWSLAIHSYLNAVLNYFRSEEFEETVEALGFIKSIIQAYPQWYDDNSDYNDVVNKLIDIEKLNDKIDADTGCDNIIQEIKELLIKPPDQQQTEPPPQPPES